MQTSEWAYSAEAPTGSALFKQDANAFVVEEDLGYSPSGEGEHIFAWVEKRNANTAYVAEQLAKYCNIPLRNVTYAGRKDKHATTRQWFGLHVPGKATFDFSTWQLPGVQVLYQTRHHKKLRVGQLRGNRFTITLTQVTHPEELQKRLVSSGINGVPNYFGEQRFGLAYHSEQGLTSGGNLALAQRWLDGEQIRDRNKRNMMLSALRSWLFNECLDVRIRQGHFDQVVNGDVVMLRGSHSIFVYRGDKDVQQRFIEQDLSPALPLWGLGKLTPEDIALEHLTAALAPHRHICEALEKVGMEMDYRPTKIWPTDLECEQVDDTVTIKFSLPAGVFATSVLRECTYLRYPELTRQMAD